MCVERTPRLDLDVGDRPEVAQRGRADVGERVGGRDHAREQQEERARAVRPAAEEHEHEALHVVHEPARGLDADVVRAEPEQAAPQLA